MKTERKIINHEITHFIILLQEQAKGLNEYLAHLLDKDGKSVFTFELEQAIHELETSIESFQTLVD